MHYTNIFGVIAVAILAVASAQVQSCDSAANCEDQAFAFAFTKDRDIDSVKTTAAKKIQVDVRTCFQPCVESARKIAKYSIAAGDNLFDTADGTSTRARGLINKPDFGPAAVAKAKANKGNNGNNGNNGNRGNNGNNGNQGNTGNANPCRPNPCRNGQRCMPSAKTCIRAPCEQYVCFGGKANAATPEPAANANAQSSFLSRFNAGRGRGRGKRQAGGNPSACVARALGMSSRAFMEECQGKAAEAKNPDVKQLLQQAEKIAPKSSPSGNAFSQLLSQIQGGNSNMGGLPGNFGNLGNLGDLSSLTSNLPGNLGNFGSLLGGNAGSLSSLFSGGRGKRAAGGKWKASANKQGELLYMFAYAKEIAAHVCPDQKDKVMHCVAQASAASGNTVDFEKINVETVKSRYCQAKNECKSRKIACETERAEETKTTCDCMQKMKQKASQCEHPPSPCDKQSDPPRKVAIAGDVCESATPTAEEMIEIIRARSGGSKEKIAKAKAAKRAKNANAARRG